LANEFKVSFKYFSTLNAGTIIENLYLMINPPLELKNHNSLNMSFTQLNFKS